MMRLVSLLLAAAIGNGGIPLAEHKARRDALRKAAGDGVVVLAGVSEPERGELRAGFWQEPNFLYLTGWNEPGAVLSITPTGEALFLPTRSEVRERYTGKKVAAGDADASAKTGFAQVYEISELKAKLADWVKGGKVWTVKGGAGEAKVKELLPGVEFEDLTGKLARLRMVKSAAEIARIQQSVDATVEAHKAAWRRIAAGLYEYQVAATMSQMYFEGGCERHAYPPIVASGPNAVILHYWANRRRIDRGELLLMDVGAECGGYAADITRTVPVSGKFTARQREIYQVVLGAQKAAIAAARPGMKFLGNGEDSLNGIARRYVDTHGKDKHGESLVKYYLHQLGHHVGLEVHDADDKSNDLEAGMVITIEPGVYIAEEGFGVRIEDMVLITESGARVLSQALPREVHEIERAMSAPRTGRVAH